MIMKNNQICKNIQKWNKNELQKYNLLINMDYKLIINIENELDWEYNDINKIK